MWMRMRKAHIELVHKNNWLPLIKDKHTWNFTSFSDAGVQFKGYKVENGFANNSLFAPYQFDLFQQCQSTSTHNASSKRMSVESVSNHTAEEVRKWEWHDTNH
jgi:hypothetical protein